MVPNVRTPNAMMCGVADCNRSAEDKIKGPDEEREEEFATGPLSLLMQVSRAAIYRAGMNASTLRRS